MIACNSFNPQEKILSIYNIRNIIFTVHLNSIFTQFIQTKILITFYIRKKIFIINLCIFASVNIDVEEG
jgi:ribosomal protein S26